MAQKKYKSVELGHGVRYEFDDPICEATKKRIDRKNQSKEKLDVILTIEEPTRVNNKMKRKQNILRELLTINLLGLFWVCCFSLLRIVAFLT